MKKSWVVEFHEEFEPEFGRFSLLVQQLILARAALLIELGPQLGRPQVDTLKGSKHPNMKELRFDADDGTWRIAFAFDTRRKAILLVGGDKSGVSRDRFYRNLIAIADRRFDRHIWRIAKEKEKR